MSSAPTSEQQGQAAEQSQSSTATLYVIPGSHACRTGMLLLEHKGIPYRTRELPTGAHPWMVRALGFPGNPGPVRDVGGRSYLLVGLIDRLGTVPALRYGDQRVQTNTKMIDFLDALQPDPPLWPSDPELRAAAQEAQRWGDEPLQMLARRLTLAGGVKGNLRDGGATGRLGALLAHNGMQRRVGAQVAGRLTFKAPGAEAKLLEELPQALEQVDRLLAAGVLNASELNAADYTIAPSLALLDYRLDLEDELRGRPSWALVERTLPA